MSSYKISKSVASRRSLSDTVKDWAVYAAIGVVAVAALLVYAFAYNALIHAINPTLAEQVRQYASPEVCASAQASNRTLLDSRRRVSRADKQWAKDVWAPLVGDDSPNPRAAQFMRQECGDMFLG